MNIDRKLIQKKGFTLIELLIVMAILGILAGFVTVTYPASQKRARDAQRRSDLKQWQAALEVFANANNALYPSYLGGIDPSNSSWLCEDLFPTENPPCPGSSDPRNGQSACVNDTVTCRYMYESNGSDGGAFDATSYVLSAPLESPNDSSETHIVVCSNGLSGYSDASGVNNTNGTCPL